MQRKISLLLVVFVIFSNFSFVLGETLSDIQNEIDDIQSEYDEKINDLSDKEQEYADLVQQIKDTKDQIEVTENEIIDTNNEIAAKQAEITDLREVQIPAMEEKAQISLKFAQENMNQNLILTILKEASKNAHPIEVTYATNKILEELYNNLVELGDLIAQAEVEEQELSDKQDELTIKQAELEAQQDYLEEVKGELSYTISQLEEEASAEKEELAAKEERQRIYEEAGCGPDDVYGVDCAQDTMPQSDSGFISPIIHGTVTNEFGGWNSILGDGMHSGIDLANDTETDVYPSAPGKVLYAGTTNDGGGNSVVILHVMDGQNFVTRYAHLNSIDVNTGDIVYDDQRIGGIGETGSATGPHLHFEIEQGSTYIWSQLEDPRIYVYWPPLWESF